MRGLLGALLLVLAGSIALLPLVYLVDLSPSPELLRAVALVGATLLVAYAIEVSWLLTVARERDGERGDWVGYVAGIGFSGLLGLALALIVSETDTASLGLGTQFVLSWALFSVALLGLLVSLLPLLVFEWSRAAPDERLTPAEEPQEDEIPEAAEGFEADEDAEDLYETRELDE